MSTHWCRRCGQEWRCGHGSWLDRHPAAAVTAGLFTLVWMSRMLSVYPAAALTMATWPVSASWGTGHYGSVSAERRWRPEPTGSTRR